MTGTKIGRRAVVVGAGMAGLPAARVLADHFEETLVLDRDALPPAASPRAGTPQARHTHGLLCGGQRALGDLYPGFEADLADGGAVPMRAGLDIRVETPGFDPFPRRDLGFAAHAMSRPLIEFTTRRCTERHRNIVIRERCRVLQLAASGDGAAVTALRCTNGDGRVETIAADLVVDASGRAGLTQGLLEAIGRPPPRETVIGVGICYATAVFAMTADPPGDWKGVMTFDAAHEGGLAGIMLPLEGGRAIVTLAGRHGDKPPADHDGFLAYARELRTPTIHAAIRESEPQGEVARFGFPASIRRHFEEIEELPRGLLPFGDSLCRFNPVWGQGMSVAAQEAALLRALLDGRSGEADPLAGLAAEFSVGAARLIDTPWALAAVPDLADPRTDGQRPADLQQRLEYSQALNRLAAEDPAVHKLQYEVLHLLKPHHALSDPEIAERVSAAAAAAPDHSTR